MSEYLDSTNWQHREAADATQGGADPAAPYGAPPVPPRGDHWGAGPTSPPPRHRGGLATLLTAFVAVAVATGAIGYLLGEHGQPSTSIQVPGSGRFPFNPFGGSGSGNLFPGFSNPGGATSSVTVPAAVRSAESALVDVDTTIDDGTAGGAGTGIVLTSDGYVLTNNHVIDGATSISVTDLGNGQTYKAQVVGYDLRADVAVIKLVGASGLAVASTSTDAVVGTTVYAVGNAGGGGGTPTVTAGKLTATNQSVTASDEFNGSSETLHGMLETSAQVISGDSGGALMTAKGVVLGIDTAGASSGSSDQSGFAIPLSAALPIADQIRAGDSSTQIHVGATALLGVFVATGASTTGARVETLQPGGPAAAAGITVNSRITSVAGQPVASGAALRVVMSTLRPGSTVAVVWVTAAGVHRVGQLTLASGPPQ